MDWFDRLFNKHKIVRRFLVVWICYEIHYVLHSTVPLVTTVDGAAVTLVSTVIAMLATGIAFYKWDRHKNAQVSD